MQVNRFSSCHLHLPEHPSTLIREKVPRRGTKNALTETTPRNCHNKDLMVRENIYVGLFDKIAIDCSLQLEVVINFKIVQMPNIFFSQQFKI